MKKQPFIFILIGLTIFIPQQLLFAESSLGSTDVSLIESKIVAIEQRIHSASTLSVRANKSLEIYRLLEQRQFLMLQLAKENRTEFLNIARKNFFTKIPSSVQKTAGHFMELPYGQEVSVFMMHEDDIGNNDSKIKVFFRDGQEELELYSRVATPPSLHGSLARLQGYKIGPAVVADTVQVVRQKEAEVLRKTTTAKLLVLLVDYEDAPRQVSREAVAEYFLGETSNIVKFFKEQSYGLFSFNFDILDWYRVPRQSNISITGQIESCANFPVSFTFVNEVLKAKGIVSLAGYDGVLVLRSDVPCNKGTGGAVVGKILFQYPYEPPYDGPRYNIGMADIRGLKRNDTDQLYAQQWWKTVAHEIGHMLGLEHASRWTCPGTEGKVLFSTCTHEEYGNRYDVMGYGDRSLHFNAVFKDWLGWNENMISVAKSGLYTMRPIENGSFPNMAVVRSPETGEPLLYLEYRQPILYDGKVYPPQPQLFNGLVINWPNTRSLDCIFESSVCEKLATVFPRSFLFNTDTYGQRQVLRLGEVFNDPVRKVYISVVEVADTHISFKVIIGLPIALGYTMVRKPSDIKVEVLLTATSTSHAFPQCRSWFWDFGDNTGSSASASCPPNENFLATEGHVLTERHSYVPREIPYEVSFVTMGQIATTSISVPLPTIATSIQAIPTTALASNPPSSLLQARAPERLTAFRVASDRVQLTWSHPADDKVAARYVLYRRSTNQIGGWYGGIHLPIITREFIDGGTGQRFYDGPPKPGQTYYYWLITESQKNDSKNSGAAITSVLVSTPQPVQTKALTPTNLIASRLPNNSAKLTWSHPADDKVAARYVLYRRSTNQIGGWYGGIHLPIITREFIDGGTGQRFYDGPPKPGQTYYYWLIAESRANDRNNSGAALVIIK